MGPDAGFAEAFTTFTPIPGGYRRRARVCTTDESASGLASSDVPHSNPDILQDSNISRSGAKFRVGLLFWTAIGGFIAIAAAACLDIPAFLVVLPLMASLTSFVISRSELIESIGTVLIILSGLAFIPWPALISPGSWIVPVIGAMVGVIGVALTSKKGDFLSLNKRASSARAHGYPRIPRGIFRSQK